MSSNRSTGLFRFQRFSMTHARSPMKIGTDGVLLGAWCDGSQARWALDVGTGCGLIALMLWGFSIDAEDAPPLPLLVVLVAIPGVVILGVLLAMIQRFREIEKGEAEDAKQY